MPLLGALPNVEVTSAEPQRRRHRLLLVVKAGAGQMEMHAVRPHHLRAATGEPETELGSVSRQEHTTGVLEDLPAEYAGPELRHAVRIARIQRHREKSRAHRPTLGVGRQGDNALLTGTKPRPARPRRACHRFPPPTRCKSF
ncbi:hypothetical protein Nm8I071_56580 [Nonomuraea sp. TT08I-71]|nr:hypothetical protein Nm8I071_56580 [Nonomuraea sp. TT08I-71]